jgi:ATPase subunit of ABC transporter with duplicated ATPase domains
MAEHLTVDSARLGYGSMEAPLFEKLNIHLAPGWTGVIGANGAGKTTLLQLICASLSTGQGRITRPPGNSRFDEVHSVYASNTTFVTGSLLSGSALVPAPW